MSNYFTYDLNAMEALAAIESESTIVSEKVDNVAIDKALEQYSAQVPGNKAELFKKLVDYANAANATERVKEDFSGVFARLKIVQEKEREARRSVRMALLQAIQAQNLVHPLDPDKDKKDVPLPPLMGFEGQRRAFYDKEDVLAYCLEHMPQFITVDYAAFDRIMVQTNALRDNKGNSILDDPDKPLPPVTVGRVARETLSQADLSELPEKLHEIVFNTDDEKLSFFDDVKAYYTQDDVYNHRLAVEYFRLYLPKYADEYELFTTPF